MGSYSRAEGLLGSIAVVRDCRVLIGVLKQSWVLIGLRRDS